jgi:N-acetylmuramoyl-L-alanine amidase
MASIAAKHRFEWETLWNLAENADLKNARNDPYVLYPGDEVFIPDIQIQEIPCQTDKRHYFVLKNNREQLRIVLTDEDDKPIAGESYVLEIDGETRLEGQTDSSGAIKEAIPPDAVKGRLLVGDGDAQREYFIGLGHIDPVEKLSGAQGRLLNLGYYDGVVDGIPGPLTTTALLLFQEKYNLPPTGENDKATQAKLKELFAS